MCRCVGRRAFRVALHVYRERRERTGIRSIIFRADFHLAARAVLPQREWAAFELHFFEGADWRACARALDLDRGNFWHWVYRAEERTGAELVRRRIFPLGEYFAFHPRGWTRGGGTASGRFLRMRSTGETMAAMGLYAVA